MKPLRNVLIRCDASRELGFGHLVRCLAIAEELRDKYGCQVSFAVREEIAAQTITSRLFAVHMPERAQPFHYEKWLSSLVETLQVKVLILDVRDQLPLVVVSSIRALGVLIVVLDDPHERRLAADLAFYPPVPQLGTLDWHGFTGTLLFGGEWVVLRKQFSRLPAKCPNDPPRVLVTMGGSDPAGLTLWVVAALARSALNFITVVVVGPGYVAREELAQALSTLGKPFELHENVNEMAALMRRADLAIATFGMTAYELAATGTPAVLLCLDVDHVTSVQGVVDAGGAVSLGLYADIASDRLTAAVDGLLLDECRRESMSKQGGFFIDGLGAQRVAARIVSAVERTAE